MCANLYSGNVFHLQKSAGLMVSPFPHSSETSSTKVRPVLLPLLTCNAVHPHSQQEDNGDTPTRRGTDTSRSTLSSLRPSWDRNHCIPILQRKKTKTKVTGRHQRAATKAPEHEPTLPGTHRVLPKAKTEVLTGPKACLAQFSTWVFTVLLNASCFLIYQTFEG